MPPLFFDCISSDISILAGDKDVNKSLDELKFRSDPSKLSLSV